MYRLTWGLVLALLSVGIAYGALTVFVGIRGYEHWLALVSLVGIGIFAACIEAAAHKRHAFVAGFLAAFLALWVQVLFHKTYFANNPSYVAADIPFGMEPLSYMIAVSPIGGFIGGILACLAASLTALAKRLYGEVRS